MLKIPLPSVELGRPSQEEPAPREVGTARFYSSRFLLQVQHLFSHPALPI